VTRPSATTAAAATRATRAAAATGVLVACTVVAALTSAGTAAAVTGYHVVSDTGPINARSGPGVQYSLVGTLPDGQAIDITCQTKGTMIGTGLAGTPTDVWDKLANGSYITDYYTSTPGLAGGWTAGIPRCPAPTPTPTPVPAPPDGCADVLVIGARGAGETTAQNGGLGTVVGPFVTALKAALPKADVKVWANPTASSSVMPVTSRSVATLKRSVTSIAAASRAKVDKHLAGCPKEHLVLVGYGPGAGAAHQVWDAVMAGTGVDRHRGRLDAVVLFADPLFDPRQRTAKAATTLGVGSFDPRRPGLIGPDTLVWSPKLSATFWMKSYCVKTDILCNTDLLHTRAGMQAHGTYASTGIATRAGTQAGQWLATRYFSAAATSRFD
jgi:hypothetical protein